MKKKLLMIINPRSGRNKKRDDLSEAIKVFDDCGYSVKSYNTLGAGDATEYARKHASEYDVVVCRGGDGTFCEMMNGVMQHDKKPEIGFVPAGTTNDLANTIGLPFAPEEAAKLITEEESRQSDLGRFNGKFFTYVASFGAFTKCSYATAQKLKNKIGRMAYFYEAAKEVKDIKAVPMKCVADGVEYTGNYVFGSVSNSYTVGKIIHMDKETVCLNDGKFELLLIEKPENVNGWAKLADCILKKHFSSKHIVFVQAEHIEITTLDGSKIPWTLDGEFGGNVDSAEIDVHKHAFRLFRPSLCNECAE